MTTTSKYREIYEDLYRRLASREWEVGDRLPSIEELLAHYEANPNSFNTVREAHKLLVEDGLVKPVPGKGTFVIALPPPENISKRDLLKKVRAAQRLLAEVETALR